MTREIVREAEERGNSGEEGKDDMFNEIERQGNRSCEKSSLSPFLTKLPTRLVERARGKNWEEWE